MDIIVKHNINWWEGGVELDCDIDRFCERLGMRKIGNKTVYKCESLKDFKILKQRLKKSKKLQLSRKGVKVELEIFANGVY